MTWRTEEKKNILRNAELYQSQRPLAISPLRTIRGSWTNPAIKDYKLLLWPVSLSSNQVKRSITVCHHCEDTRVVVVCFHIDSYCFFSPLKMQVWLLQNSICVITCLSPQIKRTQRSELRKTSFLFHQNCWEGENLDALIKNVAGATPRQTSATGAEKKLLPFCWWASPWPLSRRQEVMCEGVNECTDMVEPAYAKSTEKAGKSVFFLDNGCGRKAAV